MALNSVKEKDKTIALLSQEVFFFLREREREENKSREVMRPKKIKIGSFVCVRWTRRGGEPGDGNENFLGTHHTFFCFSFSAFCWFFFCLFGFFCCS